jgi:hypothetical protein
VDRPVDNTSLKLLDRTGACVAPTRRIPEARRARLVGWVEEIVATGLCRPLGAGRFELTCSQTELARRAGLSAASGGVSKRLSALASLGVLVSRDPVVFDLSEVVEMTAVAAPPGERSDRRGSERGYGDSRGDERSALVPTTSPLDRLEVCLELLQWVRAAGRDDLLDRTLECIGWVLAQEASPPVDVGDPRAVSAPVLFPSSPEPFPPSSAGSFSLPSSLPSSLPFSLPHAPCSSVSSPSPRPSRPVPVPASPVSAASPSGSRRYRFPRTPDAAARLQALAPLIEDCARRGLPGVSSPSGLLEAFDGYTVEQITRGVEFVRAQLLASAPLRSPVGLLAHMARTGDLLLVEDVPVQPPVHPGAPLRTPADEPAEEWLGRMASLMRLADAASSTPPV